MNRFSKNIYFGDHLPLSGQPKVAGGSGGTAKKILIIKLGAAGDVLRTTCILGAIERKHGPTCVTWVTEREHMEVLRGNPRIKAVVPEDMACRGYLQAVKFDEAINLDVSYEAAALLFMANAREKKGFVLDGDGFIRPVNQEARKWYDMSIDDDMKRENKETYHDIIHGIAGLVPGEDPPFVHIDGAAREKARVFARENGITGDLPVIGINIGGANRWERKSPGAAGWVRIVRELEERVQARYLLFGGDREKDIYDEVLSALSGAVIGTGTENDYAGFAGLLDLCDMVLTPDTLALHVASGLGKKVVVIFGPTSSAEIRLYAGGVKLTSGMECECCYREKCDKAPGCMDMMTPQRVVSAVKEVL